MTSIGTESEGESKTNRINGRTERGRVKQDKQNKEKEKEKDDEMREKQSRRLLPGSLSCAHICVQRV